jgi:tRNA wybutosine-synthesizing protein 4
VYEQVNPDDSFGRMMLVNLQARGVALPGLAAYPTLTSQEARFTGCGWSRARAWDMNTVCARHLPPCEVARANRIEWLDEVEEWQLLMAHYSIVLAVLDPRPCGGGEAAGEGNEENSDQKTAAAAAVAAAAVTTGTQPSGAASIMDGVFLGSDQPSL